MGQCVACFLVFVESGEYDCWSERVDSVWLHPDEAATRAEEINDKNRYKRKDRESAEVRPHDLHT